MKKILTGTLLLALALAVPALLLADHHTESASWTGWITDENCGAKGAKAEHKDCAERCVKNGAKWALYNTADKGVYILSNQEAAAKMAGQEVIVKGKPGKEKNTIEVESIEPVPAK
jgi:hypothetical protein